MRKEKLEKLEEMLAEAVDKKAIFDYEIAGEEIYITTDLHCKYIDTNFGEYAGLKKVLEDFIDCYISDVAEEE